MVFSLVEINPLIAHGAVNAGKSVQDLLNPAVTKDMRVLWFSRCKCPCASVLKLDHSQQFRTVGFVDE